MRDNMIVNLSGLEGHAMGADLNIEHQIGTVKVYVILYLLNTVLSDRQI